MVERDIRSQLKIVDGQYDSLHFNAGDIRRLRINECASNTALGTDADGG